MLAIIFEIKNGRYAIPCKSVIEVIPLVELRPTAETRPGLTGVFVYRGKLTPVIDLCALIAGYPCPARLSSRIVIVRSKIGDDEHTFGLLGEHVTQARQIQAGEPSYLANTGTAFLGDMMLSEGEPLQMIHVNALLGSVGKADTASLAIQTGTDGEADRTHTQP